MVQNNYILTESRSDRFSLKCEYLIVKSPVRLSHVKRRGLPVMLTNHFQSTLGLDQTLASISACHLAPRNKTLFKK